MKLGCNYRCPTLRNQYGSSYSRLLLNDIFTVFYSCLFGISEYLDEEMLIPKNTSVLIRRVPGRPRLPIVTEIEYYPKP